jgi:GlpG protein
MRQIGHLSDEQQAHTLGDFLTGSGIRNEIERDDGTWLIWIVDEDQVAAAQSALEKFRANPGGPEFRDAAKDAARARAAEAEDLAAYRRRIRTRRSMFPKFGGYGIGVLTYSLIFVCLIVAYYSQVGRNYEFTRNLTISDPEMGKTQFLPEVFAGQVWRLLTPILLHFGESHIIFNMLALFQLGCMIEGRLGTGKLALLVVGTGIISNFAQYSFSHHQSYFGGMSGVVYGLAGYIWMRGHFDRESGLYLDPTSITMMLGWLVICFTGLVGPIANTAHVVGLLSGMAWGRIAAFMASRTPK